MMKTRTTKHTSKEISDLLESDDELPDSYDEVPNIPAYQNDHRFEHFEPIKFEWLHQKLGDTISLAKLTKQSPQEQFEIDKIIPKQQSFLSKEPCPAMKTFAKQNKEKDKKVLISKGILTKRDIFFIKSIEEYATDATLLWFIDFLNYKAVQPSQRSCLVGDMTNHCTAAKEPLSDLNMRYYKLVIN